MDFPVSLQGTGLIILFSLKLICTEGIVCDKLHGLTDTLEILTKLIRVPRRITGRNVEFVTQKLPLTI